MSFQALSHSPSHERASALTSPPPTFCSFPSIKTHHPNPTVPQIPTIPPKNRNIPYWYCPPFTPSLTLPPSSLKYLQKSNPNIHRKCFRCFRCFGCFRCFISFLDHKTARFWSKSEQTRQTDRVVPPPYHGYVKHPKRQSTHLWEGAFPPACVATHDPVLQAIAVVVFWRRRLYYSCTPQKWAIISVLNERAVRNVELFRYFACKSHII